MPQDSTGPGTVLAPTIHQLATAANLAPGFGRGLPVAQASPMQVGTPPILASPMQILMSAVSPYRAPCHALTTEEELLQGTTLPCSPQQEANLLNPPVVLTDNHIKMMDALHHLDSYGLQFICESAKALCREQTPTQAPPGYPTSQASGIPCGSPNNPLLSQEFERAANNLGTAIMEPQQTPSQECLAGNRCPDPEIESAITNMHRHKQHQQTAITTHGEGAALASLPPLSSYYTWISHRLPSPLWIQNRRQKTGEPKAQDYCSLTT